MEEILDYIRRVHILRWVLLLGVVLVASNSMHIVPAGHRGVKFNAFRGVIPHSYGEGIALRMPFIESFVDMEVRINKVQDQASAASKDLQTVNASVALNYSPDPEKVHVLYQQIGPMYRERVIDPAIQEAVKAVTSLYTAEELITRREEVKDKIQDALVKRLEGDFIIISALNITNFDFSRSFNEAIESKQTAEQLALKAQRDLDRIKVEAEQKITQAKAEAESQRLLAQSVTEQVITLRIIEKWDGKLPEVMGNAVPFWDILKTK